MPVSISLTSVECIAKAMQDEYVDQILVLMRPEFDDGSPAGDQVAVVIGAPKPMAFRPGVIVELNDKLTVSVNGQPPQQWEPSATVVYEPEPKEGKHFLRVTLVNVRGVDDPYAFAKILFAIGSLAAATVAGYAVGKALAAIFAAEKASDAFDIAKKIASGGAGGLVGTALEEIAGLITDIFKDWPDCGGEVLSETVSFQEDPGEITKTTHLQKPFPERCGQPNYKIKLYVHPDDTFEPDKPVKWDCRYRPARRPNLRTYKGWWRDDRYEYGLISQNYLDGTPIYVRITPGLADGLDVVVIEKTRDRKGVAFNRAFQGVKPEWVGIMTKSPFLDKLKPDPGEDEGDRKPLSFSHQLDTTEVKLGKGRLAWWQAPFIPVVDPDRMVSRITLPEIDVQMDLYEKFCTSVGNDRIQQETLIYYRRGGRTARQAHGKPGFTVSTATLAPRSNGPA